MTVAEDVLFRVIHESLVNESKADQQMATELLGDRAVSKLPRFKQLKLAVWQSRLGPWFGPVFASLQVLFPLWLGFVWIRMLARSAAFWRVVPVPPIVFFDFFEHHLAQILAIRTESDGHQRTGKDRGVTPLTIGQVAASLGIRCAFRIIKVHARVARDLRSNRSSMATPDLMYSYNVLELLVAGAFVLEHQSTTYVTANTLQHRAYVLSWLAPHCWVAQHGKLRTSYNFPYRFNDVERIYLLTESSAADFERYYTTTDFRQLPQTIRFDQNPLGEATVLLGSSAPFIDQEIEFCRALRSVSNVPLCIKLHPINIYDERKNTLLDFADLIIDPAADVTCAVFVSMSSTYELHYQRAGIPTVSLEQESVREVLAHLEAQKSARTQ